MTWTGWDKLRNIADEKGIIYKRGDCSINPYVQAIDDLLIMKNATDVGLIFEDERGKKKKIESMLKVALTLKYAIRYQ